MRRLLLLRSAVFPALFVLASLVYATPALAGAEFCPAEAQAPLLFAAPNSNAAAFRVFAYSARSVRGDIRVQTDTGFYTAAFPEVTLGPDDMKMAVDGTIEFDQVQFISPPIYVRFPGPVGHILHLWVADALSKGDVDGWDLQGKFDCSPIAEEANTAADRPLVAIRTNPAPLPPTPPTAETPTITALAAKAPTADCDHPFSGVTVTNAVPPEFPQGVYLTVPTLVRVEVAVAATGDATDFEVLQPSGIASVDLAAMEAAKSSTYQAGTAFCRPAPGRYVFHAEFIPR